MNTQLKRALILFLFGSLLSFNGTCQSEIDSLKMGTYSMSLNVKDISTSLTFYQKLGFTPIEGMGSVEQKWIILSNGDAKLGLFQAIFPSNTMTFNPTDARKAYKEITESGIQPTMEIGMENESGPCTFSLLDPDGNPILIDQHK